MQKFLKTYLKTGLLILGLAAIQIDFVYAGEDEGEYYATPACKAFCKDYNLPAKSKGTNDGFCFCGAGSFCTYNGAQLDPPKCREKMSYYNEQTATTDAAKPASTPSLTVNAPKTTVGSCPAGKHASASFLRWECPANGKDKPLLKIPKELVDENNKVAQIAGVKGIYDNEIKEVDRAMQKEIELTKKYQSTFDKCIAKVSDKNPCYDPQDSKHTPIKTSEGAHEKLGKKAEIHRANAARLFDDKEIIEHAKTSAIRSLKNKSGEFKDGYIVDKSEPQKESSSAQASRDSGSSEASTSAETRSGGNASAGSGGGASGNTGSGGAAGAGAAGTVAGAAAAGSSEGHAGAPETSEGKPQPEKAATHASRDKTNKSDANDDDAKSDPGFEALFADKKGKKDGDEKVRTGIQVSDRCGSALRAAMINEAVHDHKESFQRFMQQPGRTGDSDRPTAADVSEFINSDFDGNGIHAKYSSYGCEGVESTLENVSSAMRLNDMVAGSAAGAAAGVAVGKTMEAQNKYGNSIETVKAGYLATASSLDGAAAIALAQVGTLAASTVPWLTSSQVGLSKAASHAKRTLQDRDTGIYSEKDGEEDKKLDGAGLAYQSGSSEVLAAQAASARGAETVQADLSEMKKLGAQVTQKQVEAGAKAAAATASAVSYLMQAQQYRDAANSLMDTATSPPLTPLIAGTPNTQLSESAPPPLVGPGSVGTGENAVTSEEQSSNLNGLGDPIPPPLFAGGGNAGGLKDIPPGQTNGMVGPGTASGGGGGGGGGGGSLPNTPAGGDGGEKQAESLTGDKTKFGESGGGGGGYMSAGGGGSKKDNSTGMSLDSLLSSFMPKKEKEAAGDITSFKGRGPSSGDDGSILGKDADLFKRASTTLSNAHRTGRVQ